MEFHISEFTFPFISTACLFSSLPAAEYTQNFFQPPHYASQPLAKSFPLFEVLLFLCKSNQPLLTQNLYIAYHVSPH